MATVEKLVIRRDPLGLSDTPWPWRIYCGTCSRVRRHYEVGEAETFADVVEETVRHAWVYHGRRL